MYTCPLCGERFETIHGLRGHFLMKHYDGETCPCCGKKFRFLYNHIIRVNNDLCHVIVRYILKPKYSGEEKQFVETILKSGLTIDKLKNIVSELIVVKNNNGKKRKEKSDVLTYRAGYLYDLMRFIHSLSTGIRSALHRCALCMLLKKYLDLNDYPYIDCYKDCAHIKVELEKHKDVLLKYIKSSNNKNENEMEQQT